MEGELYRRLELLKKVRRQDAARPQSAPVRLRTEPILSGFIKICDGVWSRVSRHEAATLRDALAGGGVLLPRGFSPERVRFFDLETTGLSGGAGTKVFLAGVAYLEGASLTLEQHLLSDYGAEPDYLSVLAERFPQDALYVSYNGKAFDAHQLRTRFLLNGRAHVLPFQLDLLYPARRLWSSILPSCSLAELERHVLRVAREQDLPSSEVPERYFTFLRDGDPQVLEPVVAHHCHDVLSLTRLLIEIQRILTDPVDYAAEGRARFDAVQAAAWLLQRAPDRAERAEQVLHSVMNGIERDARSFLRAGLLLATQYKRTGRYAEAEAIWRVLFEELGEARAAVELAKTLEHRRRDAAQALRVIRAVRPESCTVSFRKELAHRERRLRRKLERSKER